MQRMDECLKFAERWMNVSKRTVFAIAESRGQGRGDCVTHSVSPNVCLQYGNRSLVG